MRVGVLDAAAAGAERVGEGDLVGGVEGDAAVKRGAGGQRGGGGRGGRGETGGVGVGEADPLVEHERGVHELEAHILRQPPQIG